MKKIILIITAFCLTGNFAYSQIDQNRPIVSAKFDAQRDKLDIIPKDNSELSAALKEILLKRENYTLYQIPPDDPLTNKLTNIGNYLSDDRPFECDLNGTKCQGIVVDLAKSKLSMGYYIIRIKGLKSVTSNTSDSLIFEVGEAPSAPDPKTSLETAGDGSRNKIRIKSDSNIKVQPTLQVESEEYKISEDKRSIEPKNTSQTAALIDTTNGEILTAPKTGEDFTFRLPKKLSASRTNKLKISKGIQNTSGTELKEMEGNIKFPGLPSDPANLNIDSSLSFAGATKVGPSYDIEFKFDAQDLIPLKRIGFGSCVTCFFQPKIDVAIGLGKSETEDSISVDFPIRTTIQLGKFTTYNLESEENGKKIFAEVKGKPIINYYGWTKTPWYKGNIYLFVGPKLEADKKFKRINLLGSVRFDFRSYRFLASINRKRNLLIGQTFGIEKDIAELVEINAGNTFIPYIGMDFGGKVTDETLEIKEKNLLEIIPKHKIFRSYIGFKNTLETKFLSFPINITLEERLFHLASQESIGDTADGIINIRKIKGLHHYGNFSFDVFFNQTRNYSFNITVENGRKTPELKYLNKVTAGLKVRY